jgi:2'-5' RNA ligase
VTPSPNQRLFIAAEVPEALRAGCASLIDEFKPMLPGARWARPEGIHLTFKFLGSTEPGIVPEIGEVLSSVALETPVFDLFAGHPGVFGSRRRPRVLWIAVEGDVARAASLAERIEDALEPLGFERENRPHRPHLTLARFETDARTELPQTLLARASAMAGERIPVESLVLFQIYPGRGGSRFVPQGRLPLGTDRS